MTYQQALRYIHSLRKTPGHPDPNHIRALLAAMGNPQNAYRCIHVAGTNGKGSFCAMADSILRAAGYRTGLFTSPFIREFEERIRVDGKPIPQQDLADITGLVCEKAAQLDTPPGEFELITAIGFEYFRRCGVNVVVLEVGLGGRLDPTNVIKEPLLSVITGIDFDHTELLGNTLQAIAAEKGGIIKPGYPVLYGGSDDSACATLTAISAARHSRFYTVDCSRLRVTRYSLEGTEFDFGDCKGLRLPLLGTYQPGNAAAVLTAMELLNEQGDLRIPEEAVRRGLESVRWPARFELLHSGDPVVIFDGSHNPQGVSFAVRSVAEYFPEQKVHILSGVMADKDYDGMIEAMRPVAARAYAVAPDNPRALPAGEYAAHFEAHRIPARAYEDLAEGVRAAVADSRAEGHPLICLGSLYLYRSLTDALALCL